jgi:drug/metabolite transporter (DMT)-like permease
LSNPLSYALAFAGAFIWAAYCTVTSKFAKGQNGITLFVLLTALSLWVKYALSDQPEMVFSSGGREARYVWCGARVWLCRVEYWHSAR